MTASWAGAERGASAAGLAHSLSRDARSEIAHPAALRRTGVGSRGRALPQPRFRSSVPRRWFRLAGLRCATLRLGRWGMAQGSAARGIPAPARRAQVRDLKRLRLVPISQRIRKFLQRLIVETARRMARSILCLFRISITPS